MTGGMQQQGRGAEQERTGQAGPGGQAGRQATVVGGVCSLVCWVVGRVLMLLVVVREKFDVDCAVLGMLLGW